MKKVIAALTSCALILSMSVGMTAFAADEKTFDWCDHVQEKIENVEDYAAQLKAHIDEQKAEIQESVEDIKGEIEDCVAKGVIIRETVEELVKTNKEKLEGYKAEIEKYLADPTCPADDISVLVPEGAMTEEEIAALQEKVSELKKLCIELKNSKEEYEQYAAQIEEMVKNKDTNCEDYYNLLVEVNNCNMRKAATVMEIQKLLVEIHDILAEAVKNYEPTVA